jgi:hypothetical protein
MHTQVTCENLDRTSSKLWANIKESTTANVTPTTLTSLSISLTLIIHSCQINNPLLSLFLVQTTTLCTLLCKYKSPCSFSPHYSSQPIFFLFHFLADIPYFNDQDQIKDSLLKCRIYLTQSSIHPSLRENCISCKLYSSGSLSNYFWFPLLCLCIQM